MALPQGYNLDQEAADSIAVVGFSLKFPQHANSAEEFWNMLIEGRSAMTEVPPERFNIDAFYHENAERHDTMNARGGHFLSEDIAAFDAPFFSMGRVEAECIDPQQRGLLEGTYHALENAGIPMETAIGSKTSVFVGSFSREYDVMFCRDPELQAKYKATGTGPAMLANRLSWFFDFRGPSISLDTACSSSLNALHLCCQSLRSRESTMGLVCGSNLFLNPETNSIPLSNMNFLSPDSKCFSFDHRANGYSRGEGSAVVVLKLLHQAVKDGDLIRAVIRATGANQDGRTPGISQPNSNAQEELIRHTYDAAGLNPSTTQFFEAHGTGTTVGDYMETTAIGKMFRGHRDPAVPLRIGAVKSNIGHLEGAAGLAGLIKTVLVLEKGIIPPNIWFEKPNPSIDIHEWNIKFPIESEPWPTTGIRRASINSFGYGGANAHAVLDDAYNFLQLRGLRGKHCTTVSSTANPAPCTSHGFPGADDKCESGVKVSKIFIWSSSDESGIERLTERYTKHISQLQNPSNQYLDDLAYTLSERRSSLPWKSFTVADSVADLLRKMQSGLSKPVRSYTGSMSVTFIFTGQGAHWARMAQDLYVLPAFRESIERTEAHLKSLGCDWSVRDEMLKMDPESKAKSAAYSQPLCTALQIALVDLLAECNINPSNVLGHSSGEIAAAYCAGAISQRYACRLALYRGKVAAHLTTDSRLRGSMMAVALPEFEVATYLTKLQTRPGNGSIAVGCVNSPTNVTITGDATEIEVLKSMLEADKVYVRRLDVDVAYHSTHMNRVAAEYLELIRDLEEPDQPKSIKKLPMYSSVTGSVVSAKELATGEYWVQNLVSKVNFSDALKHMYLDNVQRSTGIQAQTQGKNSVYIMELGPHSVLQRSVNETIRELGNAHTVAYGSAIVRGISAQQTICEQAGNLKCGGFNVDLRVLNHPAKRSLVMSPLATLPQYPFNHDHSYWLESRLSRNFRFRSHGRHELLGTRVNDWNPLSARWRNIIRASENPWIADHKFNGSELYPAAGMLVMAVEAARQMHDHSLTICGYKFEEVQFLKPLLITLDPEGVETQFELRPHKADNVSAHAYFQLYTYSRENWIEVCRGSILTLFERGGTKPLPHNLLTGGPEPKLGIIADVKSSLCTRSVDKVDFYKNLDDLGFHFGPSFQSLNNVTYSGDGRAAAGLDLLHWRSAIPGRRCQSHVIHPVALDGAFHLTIAALANGGWDAIPTMVPTKLRTMYVSAKLHSESPITALRLSANQTFRGFREAEYSVFGRDDSSGECLISLEGYRATAISTLESSVANWADHRPLGYKFAWLPDWTILTNEEAAIYCSAAAEHCVRPSQKEIEQSERTCLNFLKMMLLEVQAIQGFEPRKGHLKRYLGWAQRQEDQFHRIYSRNCGEYSESELSYQGENMPTDLKEDSAWELYNKVGERLLPILQDVIDPLDLLIRDSPLEAFYSGSTFAASYRMLAAYVTLLTHKNPDLKILEIGAGTGGATAYVLDCIADQGDSEAKALKCSQYVYTDVSPGFLEGAKNRFRMYGQKLSFRTLDIEKNFETQGLDTGYDLIIAASVLHATSDMDSALCNARRLLKSGGKLIFFEPTNRNCLRIPFVFGLLPGWWLGTSAQDRYWSPLWSDAKWHEALKRNGFSGADIILHDAEGPAQGFSTIVATALPMEEDAPLDLHTIVITAENSPLQQDTAAALKSIVESCPEPQPTYEVTHYQDVIVREPRRTVCIFLVELDAPVLQTMPERFWKTLKEVLGSVRSVLWLTGGGDELANPPDFALVTGLGRSINSESSNLHFVELVVEGSLSPEILASFVGRVYKKMLPAPNKQSETEYIGRKGLLLIPRIFEDTCLNEFVNLKTGVHVASMRPWKGDGDRAVQLTINSPGLLDSFQFIDDSKVDEPLKPDEIEIDVKAVGVNFKDVMIAMGQLPSDSIGLECSGVITKVGETAASSFQPGDRVCSLAQGAYKTHVRSFDSIAAHIPAGVSFETAAAIPLIFCTAYHSLLNVARLSGGESVLINSGAGGVGQAAIQVAQLQGAEVYVTVGEEDKRRLLVENYGMSYDHIFVGRGSDFLDQARATRPDGFNVVLNSRAGKGLHGSLDCLADFGRFIEIGKADIEANENLPLARFGRNISFSSIAIDKMPKEPLGQVMTAVIALFKEGKIRVPYPLQIKRIAELEQAFRNLQSGKSMGKTVVSMNEQDLVPTCPRKQPAYRFDRNATYIVVGGFGGLGRSIVRWMVEWGARHVLILSRSGPTTTDAIVLLKEMAAKGANVVAPSCDIGDADLLASVLRDQSQTMPPIKGCIQGAMVLKDGLFENMSKENFQAAIRPKAPGSWNLHLQLPQNIDFYILLSSTGGVIGSRGQSNYAAGNTYQDALAQYRVSRGLRCVSLDLGMILAVGFAAENRDVTKRLGVSYRGIREAELHAVLDYLCDPSRVFSSPTDAQIVTGLERPISNMSTRGDDKPYWLDKPMFRSLLNTAVDKTHSNTHADSESETNYGALLNSARNLDDAAIVVTQALVNRLSTILGLGQKDIDIQKPMQMLGVDSLVAVEVRYWLRMHFKAELSIFEMLGNTSLAALGYIIANKSELFDSTSKEDTE